MCQINPADKETLTCYFDVISSHHSSLSRSVIHQSEFSEVFPWMELVHLGFTGNDINILPSKYLFTSFSSPSICLRTTNVPVSTKYIPFPLSPWCHNILGVE